MAFDEHTHPDGEKESGEQKFVNGIKKAFFIVLLTILLIAIRNKMSKTSYFNDNPILKWSIFCFIVIIFMMLMTGIQGSTFMSLMTVIVILVAVTMIIWTTAGTLVASTPV